MDLDVILKPRRILSVRQTDGDAVPGCAGCCRLLEIVILPVRELQLEEGADLCTDSVPADDDHRLKIAFRILLSF